MTDKDYLKEKTNEELLALYRQEGRQEIKQELTMRYVYIVRCIAVQMRNVYARSLPMEDIINEGVIVIMKGLDRYDPEKDTKFETYISQRIRGMIIDLVRKQDWLPRDYRKKSREMEDARSSLVQSLGREPTEEELAEHMHMNLKKFRKLQSMGQVMDLLSLDMVQEGNGGQSEQIVSGNLAAQPEQAVLKAETGQLLKEAVKNALNEKEQLMISLYYVEELSMVQTARIMGVSEPRVSQIHSAAVRKLKRYMEGYK